MFSRAPSVLSIVLLAATTASGENRLTVPSVLVSEGGRSDVFIGCSHDVTVAGFSLALRYDAAALAVGPIDMAGTSVEPLVSPEFLNLIHNAAKGEIILGVILEVTGPLLPPAAHHTLARLSVRALAAAPAKAAIDFVDGLGSPYPIQNVLTDDGARSVRAPQLILVSGSVGIARPDAGPDRQAPEDSEILLDGSGTRWPAGWARTILWRQTMGPAARILAGADTLQPRILLPQVSGDTALVFELSAGDGTTTLTDQMVVTVLDLDLRSGSLGIDAGFGGELIDGGTRAVVFQGDLAWNSGLEDGTWTRAVFHAGGRGNEAKLLSGAGLYVDANGNGSYDAADRQVGNAAILAKDDGEIQFTLSEALQLGAAKRFFLVADVRQGAAGAGLGFASVLAAILTAWLSGRRRRMGRGAASIPGALVPGLAAFLLTGFLLAAAISCSGGGGGGGTPATPASREVRFDILSPGDLGLEGAATGVPIQVKGLPARGPALQV